MNYLIEILAFMDRVIVERPSTGQICLWHALMYVCNKCGWKKQFTVANATLQMLTGLSRNGIYQARTALKSMGLIDFQPNGTHATIYTLHSAQAFGMSESVQVAVQESVQVPSQLSIQEAIQPSATLDKPNEEKPNKTKGSVTHKKHVRKKKGSKSSYREGTQAYAECVFLTPEEYNTLCSHYGATGAARMVEILDNYKGSTGKEYIDDNRVIKNWVIKRWQEEQSHTTLPSLRSSALSSSYDHSEDFFSEVKK